MGGGFVGGGGVCGGGGGGYSRGIRSRRGTRPVHADQASGRARVVLTKPPPPSPTVFFGWEAAALGHVNGGSRAVPLQTTTGPSPSMDRSSAQSTAGGGGGHTGGHRAEGRHAFEGKGPRRRPQNRLDGRLEEVAKAVGGGYCRLQMPLRLA